MVLPLLVTLGPKAQILHSAPLGVRQLSESVCTSATGGQRLISPVCFEVDPRAMWPQPSLVVEHGGACSLGTQSPVFHRRDAGSQFLERGPLGSWGFSHRKNVGKVLSKETPGAPSSWGDLDSAHHQLPGGPQGNSFFNLSFLLSEMAFPLGFPFQGCRGAGMR